jgi:hypothetical protein
LLSQASSLADVDLLNINDIPSDAVVTIINNLNRLSSLKINISNLSSNQKFYDKLKPNLSLKCLWLKRCESLTCDDVFKTFMRSFPNVEKVDLNGNVAFDISFIAADNPKLTELKLSSLSTPIAAKVQFKNLKTLTIGSTNKSKAA